MSLQNKDVGAIELSAAPLQPHFPCGHANNTKPIVSKNRLVIFSAHGGCGCLEFLDGTSGEVNPARRLGAPCRRRGSKFSTPTYNLFVVQRDAKKKSTFLGGLLLKDGVCKSLRVCVRKALRTLAPCSSHHSGYPQMREVRYAPLRGEDCVRRVEIRCVAPASLPATWEAR